MSFGAGLTRTVSVFLCVSFFSVNAAFAGKPAPSVPDPDLLVTEAQKLVSISDIAAYEQLPVEESRNDGYWWNKQNMADKLAYVKQLVISFKLPEKKVSVKKVVRMLDMEYNPRDNPLDIKIDKSVERMFNIVTKEMALK